MTPQEQNIAVAKALGFTDIRVEHMEHVDIDARETCEWDELRGTLNGKRHRIADYFNDLNAISQAVDSLLYEDQIEWCYALGKVCGFRNKNHWVDIVLFNATAEQRTKAFLQATRAGQESEPIAQKKAVRPVEFTNTELGDEG